MKVQPYILVHKSVWSELLKDVLCGSCYSTSVIIQTRECHGYAVKLVTKCTECEFVCGQSYSAPRVKNQDSSRPVFDIN